MKTLKITLAVLLFGASFTFAQEVNYNNEIYTVKRKKVYKDGKDQTELLTETAQEEIITRFERLEEQEKELEKAEKALKKAEKKQKEAERELKKKEKEQKRKKTAEKNLKRAEDKYKSENKKFERRKRKGKLSPDDYEKWEKKFNKLRANITKAEKRLKRL